MSERQPVGFYFATPISAAEVVEAQANDDLFQRIGASDKIGDRFIETEDGIVRLISPEDPRERKFLVPRGIRPSFFNLGHYAKFSVHPVKRWMRANLRKTWYWPQMAADVNSKLRRMHPEPSTAPEEG